MDTLDFNANKRGLKHYLKTSLSIKGRLSRSIYWRYKLSLVCLLIAVGFPTLLSIAILPSISETIFMTIIFLEYILYMVPNCCLTIRRLHDAGFSGWWILLIFCPFIDIIPSILCLLRSQEKDNQYGKYQKDEGNYIIPLFLTIALMLLIVTALINIQS